MISRFERWLRRRAWPAYDCLDCIGMRDHGCYCDAMGAHAPAGEFWPHPALAWVHGFLFSWTSPYWTDPEQGLDKATTRHLV